MGDGVGVDVVVVVDFLVLAAFAMVALQVVVVLGG